MDMLQLAQTNVAPGDEARKAKPRQGDIRYADGVNWNPGGTGEGIYAYLNNSGSPDWTKL